MLFSGPFRGFMHCYVFLLVYDVGRALALCCIVLQGDGNKEDDETVILNLKTFEERVHKILVFINVYEAKERGHELSLCSALYVRVFDQVCPLPYDIPC